jgi:PmbA protein
VNDEALLRGVMNRLRAAGFDRVQVSVAETRKDEFNIQHGAINLLRTGINTSLSLTGIRAQRHASLTLNRLDPGAIDGAVRSLTEMAEAAAPDPAQDIAPAQPAADFASGPEAADYDLMYDRLEAFLEHSRDHHPTTILEECILDFTRYESRLLNSNGVDFSCRQGIYGFQATFTSKEGGDTSSFNYSGFTARDLDAPLWTRGHLDPLMKQSAEQVRTGQIPGKFRGPVIITPHALEEFIGFLTEQVDTGPMVAGTSIYRDRLGTAVASDLLTVRCGPRSPEIADGYFLTGDGIEARDLTLVDAGRLRSYLLDIYGANKTGLERAANDGGCLIVEPGKTGLEEMIAGVERGILLCRFSGGAPNDKGDFSGVAKNSYYIRDGRVEHPVSETMISGNMARLLLDIDAVSRERVDFGSDILPWVRVQGLTIS